MSLSIASHNQDFGPKLSPDPSWTGPLNVKRSTTNVISLIIFMLCFICWIVVPLSSKPTKKKKKKTNCPTIALSIVLGMLVFSALLSTLKICLMRIAPMKVIYASIGLISVSLVFGVGLYVYKCAVQGYWKWDHWLPLVILSIFLLVPVSALTSDAINRYKLASQIIPEFAKVALFFPSLYLYVTLIFALCCCAFIGGHAAVMSNNVFPRWFFVTWGYHLGSAAIGGVVLPVCFVVLICKGTGARIAALGATTWRSSRWRFTDGPLLESARMAHNLWHRNYERSEKIAENVKYSTVIIWFSVWLTSPFLVHRGVLLALSRDKMFFRFYIFPLIFNSVLAFIMIQLINIACDTVLLCVLENHEVNGKNARNMSDKLKQLIFETERK
uniref:Uncharacterized protein n=1 Tax=Trichogramma kaykai TaxID=54128 RepID=A0ABD2X5R1_9HYME